MTTISSGISSSSGWGSMPPRTEGRGGKPSFSNIDADSSGGLDQTELQAMLDKGPKGAQRSDGTSSTAASGSTATEALFSQLDADGDGSLTEAELDQGMKPPERNSHSDQNNAFASMGMDTQGFAAMMGGGMGMGGMPPPPPPPEGASGASLSDLDSDSDGSITASEFGLSSTSGTDTSAITSTDSTQQSLFDLIDGDQSGELSSDEVSSFQDKMKALFDKMQQMGAQQMASANSLSLIV